MALLQGKEICSASIIFIKARISVVQENVGSIAFAHNSKGYDAHFLLQYLFENGVPPKVIPKGREVMVLSACGIRILDSLNFLPFPLSALPKAFNLKEMKKG